MFFVSKEDELLLRYGLRPAADAQRLAEQVDLEVHRNTWRYHYLLEQHRTTVAAYREEILTTDRALEVMARFHPVGPRLAAAARQLVLFHLDQAWAGYLSDMAELREGIHLRSIANLDPLDEFHRAAVPAFQELLTQVEARTIETFEEVDLSEGWQPERAEIVRPSATWTYLVHDNPFGSELDRLIAAVVRRLTSGS